MVHRRPLFLSTTLQNLRNWCQNNRSFGNFDDKLVSKCLIFWQIWLVSKYLNYELWNWCRSTWSFGKFGYKYVSKYLIFWQICWQIGVKIHDLLSKASENWKIQGAFFYCSAQKTTKYKEKLKYQNCSANCSSQKILSTRKKQSIRTETTAHVYSCISTSRVSKHFLQ